MATVTARTIELAEVVDLEKRVAVLERAGTYRIRMAPADLLRLQPGDVIVLRIRTPLADSETKRLVAGWQDVINAIGLGGQVHLMVLAGAECTIEVVRGEAKA